MSTDLAEHLDVLDTSPRIRPDAWAALAQRRRRVQLTREQVADRIGWHRNSLHEWERGRTRSTLAAYQAALEVIEHAELALLDTLQALHPNHTNREDHQQ